MCAVGAVLETPDEGHEEGEPGVLVDYNVGYHYGALDEDEDHVRHSSHAVAVPIDDLADEQAAHHLTHSQSHHCKHRFHKLVLVVITWNGISDDRH